jgi:predicted RNA methylase
MSGPLQSGLGNVGDRRGGSFYEDPDLFERYRQHRAWPLNPNIVMEAPALLEELGPVSGLRVLDLGCGDAEIGRELLNAGAERYLGIDGSARMVEAARRTLEDTTGGGLVRYRGPG